MPSRNSSSPPPRRRTPDTADPSPPADPGSAAQASAVGEGNGGSAGQPSAARYLDVLMPPLIPVHGTSRGVFNKMGSYMSSLSRILLLLATLDHYFFRVALSEQSKGGQ